MEEGDDEIIIEKSTQRRRKKIKCDIGKFKKLEDYFARAVEEYVCLVCGETVKYGLRLTHDAECRLRSDDEDVIFVEEIPKTQDSNIDNKAAEGTSTKGPRAIDGDTELSKDPITKSFVKGNRSKFNKWLIPLMLSSQSETISNDDPTTFEPWSKRLRTGTAEIEPSEKIEVITGARNFLNEGISDVFSNAGSVVEEHDIDEADVGSVLEDDAGSVMEEHVADETFASETSVALNESIDLFLDNAMVDKCTAPVQVMKICEIASTSYPLPNEDADLALNNTQDDFDDEAEDAMSVQVDDKTEWASDTGSSTKLPFLVKAFTGIVKRVSDDEFYAHLFNEKDRREVSVYLNMPSDAQLLFCRLMSRNRTCITSNSLKNRYGKFINIAYALRILNGYGFIDSIDQMNDLPEILDALQLNQLQDMARTDFRLKDVQGPKQRLIDKLLEYANTQYSLTGSMEKIMVERAKKELGDCYKLTEEIYLLFLCVLHIFSPKDMVSRSMANGQMSSIAALINGLIRTLGQKASNALIFPTGTGIRQRCLFKNRKELRKYVRANIWEASMYQALQKKEYDTCEELNDGAMKLLRKVLATQDTAFDQLPPYLRKYTGIRVLLHIADYGVACFEKQRKYEQAVAQLRELVTLSEGDWWPQGRSRWYERLALNLDKHLKHEHEALSMIESSWDDRSLTCIIRRSLFDRAERIVDSLVSKEKNKRKQNTLKGRLKKLSGDFVKTEVPQVIIKGELLTKNLGGRLKTIFATKNTDDGSVTARNVEEVARMHYIRKFGFTDGIHGEGSPWLSLFGMFFWDSIYDKNIPDTFVCSQQWEPLDLNDKQFYHRRISQIGRRMNLLKFEPLEESLEALRKCWNDHRNEASSLVSWHLFEDFDQVAAMVTCITGITLGAVFERLLRDFRAFRSGFPDLLLWNVDKQSFKVVEVKGPGDCLSMKQRLWLEFFIKNGASAEICHVKGVSGKRININETT